MINYLMAFWMFLFLAIVIGMDIYYGDKPDYIIYAILFLQGLLLVARERLGEGLRGRKGLKTPSNATAKSREFSAGKRDGVCGGEKVG
jgi:hypothetical protein